MPTVILNEIECIDPRGVRDDMMLTLTSDEFSGGMIWGPHRMRAGNRVDLRAHLEPIVFDDFARIALYEHDTIGRNDYFGRIYFYGAREDGDFDHYFPSEFNSRYRINYTYRQEPTAPAEGIIRPLSLTCNDAQGTSDRVTLQINDSYILGPRTFKTGWDVEFLDLEIAFRSCCEVRLRETRGQDWSRSFRLNRGEYATGVEQETAFSADRGIIGDARYTFRYIMLA